MEQASVRRRKGAVNRQPATSLLSPTTASTEHCATPSQSSTDSEKTERNCQSTEASWVSVAQAKVQRIPDFLTGLSSQLPPSLHDYMKSHPKSDCIIGIGGGWYDVTSFRHRHPGGSVILKHCHLQDVTEAFHSMHGRNVLRGWRPVATYTPLAEESLSHGSLGPASSPLKPQRHESLSFRSDPHLEASYATVEELRKTRRVFTELHEALVKEGYFETSYYWYAGKFCVAFLFLLLSSLIMARARFPALFSGAPPMPGTGAPSSLLIRLQQLAFPVAAPRSPTLTETVLSGLLWGLFWQQCGFLMHDLMHSELTHACLVDRWIGLFFGSLLFGISAHWWRDEHFEHHVFTNGVDPKAGYADPQMQEIIWSQSPKLFPLFYNRGNLVLDWFQAQLIYFQSITWAPVCVFLGRIGIVGTSLARETRWYEVLAHGCHQIGLFAFLRLFLPSWRLCAVFYMTASVYEGVLHLQLLISHYCKPWILLDDLFTSVGWYRSQVLANVNIKNPVWLDWFHGGLNFHIEHHLFPLMPRHRLRDASYRVRQACEQVGLPYHEVGWMEGIQKTISHLKKVAGLYSPGGDTRTVSN